MAPVDLEPVQAREHAQHGGAVVVDLGAPKDFALGHPEGAISLPFSEKGLSDRLSNVLPSGTPVILAAASPEQAEAAAIGLAGSSFLLVGVIKGGRGAWSEAGLPSSSLAEVPVESLASPSSPEIMVVLDVREPMEWETGHVPGALLFSLGSLREHVHEIPRQAHIAVICESGVRSSTAASILRIEGFSNVANVPEGTGGYRHAGLPLQYPEVQPD